MRVLLPAARTRTPPNIERLDSATPGGDDTPIEEVLPDIGDRVTEPLPDPDPGLPAEGSCCTNVSARLPGLAGEIRLIMRIEIGAEFRLDQSICRTDRVALTTPEVEDPTGRPGIGQTEEVEIIDIIDIDEITALLTRPIDSRPLTAQ